jgi:hypothetical protein
MVNNKINYTIANNFYIISSIDDCLGNKFFFQTGFTYNNYVGWKMAFITKIGGKMVDPSMLNVVAKLNNIIE